MIKRLLTWITIGGVGILAGCVGFTPEPAQKTAIIMVQATPAPTPSPTPDPDANQFTLSIADLEVTRAHAGGGRLSVDFEYAANWQFKNYSIAFPKNEITWTLTGHQGRYRAEGRTTVQPVLGMYLPGRRLNGPFSETQCMVLTLGPKPATNLANNDDPSANPIAPASGEYELQVCLALDSTGGR